jgi:hypothetical protein
MSTQIDPNGIALPSEPGQATMTVGAAPDAPPIVPAVAPTTQFGVGIGFTVGTTTPKTITIMADDVSQWIAGTLEFKLPQPYTLPSVQDLVDWSAGKFGFTAPDWTVDPFKTIGSVSLTLNQFEIRTEAKVLKKLLLDMRVNTVLQVPYIPVTVTALYFRLDYAPV